MLSLSFRYFIVVIIMIRLVNSSRYRSSLGLLIPSSIISASNSTSTTSITSPTTTTKSIDLHSIDDDFSKFYKVKDEVVFQGWRQIIRRPFQLPNGSVKDFDILSTKTSIVVFNWDTKTKTTTLIQEYHPGIEKGIIINHSTIIKIILMLFIKHYTEPWLVCMKTISIKIHWNAHNLN